jgi:hypothetical protein
MNINEIYNNWKQYRKKIDLNENFSSQIIKRIQELDEREKITKLFNHIFPEFGFLPNWIMRLAFTLGLLALQYKWAY